MKTKKHCLQLILVMVLGMTSTAEAAQDIKVLLFRGTGVSSTNALLVLSQMNATLASSQMGSSYRVATARVVAGAPFVDDVICSSSNSQILVECIAIELASKRNTYAADVVVLVVKNLDQCGSTRPGTVNRPAIGQQNQHLAYAVIKEECLELPENGMKIASHEIGHILSLEHSDDSPVGSLVPVPFNHAAEDWDDLTVMGNETGGGGDCPITNCAINDFYSEVSRDFPDGGSAGDLTYSNAKNVMTSISWDTVAAYRPISPPAAPACGISIVPYCDGSQFMAEYSVTPTLPGYTITSQTLELDNLFGGGWQEIFEGALSCIGVPVFSTSKVRASLWTSLGSLSQCELTIGVTTCGGGFPQF